MSGDVVPGCAADGRTSAGAGCDGGGSAARGGAVGAPTAGSAAGLGFVARPPIHTAAVNATTKPAAAAAASGRRDELAGRGSAAAPVGANSAIGFSPADNCRSDAAVLTCGSPTVLDCCEYAVSSARSHTRLTMRGTPRETRATDVMASSVNVAGRPDSFHSAIAAARSRAPGTLELVAISRATVTR